ncbi:MAG TPA: DUF177 domain-containing protein [Gemmatimonadaceae bacterium]|nr:DUF177 domain-containing protein [Gemmatimonadaceae bacterium]
MNGNLDLDDPVWTDGDAKPATPVHATGRLSRAGTGRYYWSGRIEANAVVACRRCLKDVSTSVSDEVHVLFVEQGDEVADDPDTYRIPPNARNIDLRPAVREQWMLAAPEYMLCGDDCRGLCARCGADLNAGPCDCPPETDSRWTALTAARRVSN